MNEESPSDDTVQDSWREAYDPDALKVGDMVRIKISHYTYSTMYNSYKWSFSAKEQEYVFAIDGKIGIIVGSKPAKYAWQVLVKDKIYDVYHRDLVRYD